MGENPFKAYKKPLLAIIGNPLLDIIVPIPSMKYLEDCNISGKKILEDEEFNELFEAVRTRTDLKSWPGGSAQITAQLFQWIVDIPGYTVVMGCIGIDSYGKQMKTLVESKGIDAKYTIVHGKRTGICLSLVCGKEKAAVANLGAAVSSSSENFFNKEFIELLKKVPLIYMEGFFITHGYLSMMEILSLCKQHGIFMIFNMSAINLVHDYFDKMVQLVTNSDMVIGNKDEFVIMAKLCNWNATDDIKEVIKAIAKHSHVRPDKYKKQFLPELFHQYPIIIATNGSKPVTIGHGLKSPPVEYPLVGIDQNKIRDDTGGGDAFVSGFLAAACLGFDLGSCVRYGSELANIILQQLGVSIPIEKPQWLKEMFERVVPSKK